MPGKRPTKPELAQFKAMHDMGVSPTAISRKMGKSHNTVLRYIHSDVYYEPELEKMVQIIKEKELQDLYLLGAKGRKRLHELLDHVKRTIPLTTFSKQYHFLLK